jgi:hypothetical protein
VDIHESSSLFAVEQVFKNMAGIEHSSYTPIYHDALDCSACLHHLKGAICISWIIAEALSGTGVAPGHRRELKAL